MVAPSLKNKGKSSRVGIYCPPSNLLLLTNVKGILKLHTLFYPGLAYPITTLSLTKACSILSRLFVRILMHRLMFFKCSHSFYMPGAQPSVDFYDSALQQRALTVQPLPNRQQLMADLQHHLGKGAAPPISDIPESFANRECTGARALASDFAECSPPPRFFLFLHGTLAATPQGSSFTHAAP